MKNQCNMYCFLSLFCVSVWTVAKHRNKQQLILLTNSQIHCLAGVSAIVIGITYIAMTNGGRKLGVYDIEFIPFVI